MMIQEFEKLTGIEVSMEEYAEIEQMYYDFDGDKQAFCKKFVKDNGMVTVLRKLLKVEKEDHRGAELELAELRKNYETYSRDMVSAVEKLKKELEKEQEWKPWVPENAVSQEKYDKLRNDSTSHEMTDEEATEWIAEEWGFDPAKIRINHKMKEYEVNRHHQLRQVGEKWRNAWYDATDWYYVFFTVRGMEYEAYNGQLIQL